MENCIYWGRRNCSTPIFINACSRKHKIHPQPTHSGGKKKLHLINTGMLPRMHKTSPVPEAPHCVCGLNILFYCHCITVGHFVLISNLSKHFHNMQKKCIRQKTPGAGHFQNKTLCHQRESSISSSDSSDSAVCPTSLPLLLSPGCCR